jgi:hypothetical protein
MVGLLALGGLLCVINAVVAASASAQTLQQLTVINVAFVVERL